MVTGLWYTHDPNSCSLSWFCRWKEHPCPLSPDFGLWRMLEAPEWGLASFLDLDMVGGLWYTHNLNVVPLSWFWSSKEYLSPLSTDLVLLRMMEVPDYGLVFWTQLGYGFWSLIHPHSEFWLSLLILKVQRTTMSFKTCFGDLGEVVASTQDPNQDKGYGCSLHFQNQDRELKFGILVYQRPVTSPNQDQDANPQSGPSSMTKL